MMNKTFAVACLMACAMSAKVRMNKLSSDLAQTENDEGKYGKRWTPDAKTDNRLA